MATVDDPSYRPYVTAAMVRRAHRLGMAVIPWTVDDEATMRSLIDAGVDGLITNYPDRLRHVMQERLPLPPGTSRADLAQNPQVRRQTRAEPPGLQEGRGQRRVRSRRSATCGETEGSRPSPIAR